MPYIGNPITSGENNSFKVLDDITSYTLTFNGSSASIVSVANNTITYNSHRFITGQRVTYNTTGTTITGLTAATVYFIIKEDQNTIKLATTYANAINNTAIDLTGLGTGTTHTINVAFDGVNTKFKATYDNGTKALITRAGQLQISINGVIQQPQDTTSPTNGFGIDLDGVIIFSTAPANTDIFWGNVFANNFATFDISDNTVDSFTGNGSLVDFTLSKIPANNQNILVTIDGVVQYPSDNTTIRAYGLSENILTFVGAPGNATAIQVRHIGFAGATSSSVTGFYGRTGNVGLTTADTVSVGSLVVSGISTLGITTATNLTAQSLIVSGNIIQTSGLVGIGTTNPLQRFQIGVANTVGVSTDGKVFVVTTDGKVGVGTTNPTVALDIIGNVKVGGIITATSFSGSNTNITGLSTFSGGIQVGDNTSITVGSAFIKNNAVGLGTTNSTGRDAGISTAAGTLIFNVTTTNIEFYNGNAWVSIKSFNATGGTITFSGGKTIHTFTGSGTFSVNSGSSDVEYLVIAGGGGGGSDGAGGGAGGYRSSVGGESSGGGTLAEGTLSVTPGSYSITIGGAGAGSTSNSVKGTSGNPSIFSTITSIGGGGGASRSDINGAPGGSGGGSGGIGPSGTVGLGTANQGFNGGAAFDNGLTSGYGGGGGAGAVGGTASASTGGTGGNGVSSSISGISVTRGGGGGGGQGDATVAIGVGGTGGSGGGGNGSSDNVTATVGSVNTGGGGGGGGRQGGFTNGASGGSGIVIITYPS